MGKVVLYGLEINRLKKYLDCRICPLHLWPFIDLKYGQTRQYSIEEIYCCLGMRAMALTLALSSLLVTSPPRASTSLLL